MRFIGGLEELLDPIVAVLDALPAHFDPDHAPRDILSLLAAWLGVDLDESQEIRHQREMVRRAADLGRKRGTVAGMELALKLAFPDVPLRDRGPGRRALVARPAPGRRAAALVRRLLRQARRRGGPGGHRPLHRAAQAGRNFIPPEGEGTEEERHVMRTCQSCGLQNPPDRDFCECGEYLRWEPTGYVQAITPEMAAQAAAEAAAPAGEQAAAPPPAPRRPTPPPAAAPAPAPQPPAAPARARRHPAAAPRRPRPRTVPDNGNGSGLTTGDPLGGSPTAPPPPPPAQPPAAPAPAHRGPAGRAGPARAAGAARSRPQPPSPTPRASRCACPTATPTTSTRSRSSIEPGQRDRVLALVRNQGSDRRQLPAARRGDARRLVVDLPRHRLPRPVRHRRHLRAGGGDPPPPAALARGRGQAVGAAGRRALQGAGAAPPRPRRWGW